LLGSISTSSTRNLRTVSSSISIRLKRAFPIERRPIARAPIAKAPTAIAPKASDPNANVPTAPAPTAPVPADADWTETRDLRSVIFAFNLAAGFVSDGHLD